MKSTALLKTALLSASICALMLILAIAVDADASQFTDILNPASPGHFDATIFGAGFGSELYGATHEGVELEQSLTAGIGAVARISTYQLYHGSGFDNPIKPVPGQNAPFFFGRVAGGIDVVPWTSTHLLVLGGRDFGDSNSSSIGAEFSTWAFIHSIHPANFSLGFNHYYENEVSNGLIDIRMVCFSTGSMLLMAGAGSAIWGGGTLGPKVQVGPDLGVYLRRFKLKLDLQTGYGSDHFYGLLSFSRQFAWEE
ncbi:MAG TPA: hypothetical protein VMD75_17990 [Candidatus Binataceae bacterium]|nr:hypothetical protein [Candidatus Binataceae bacterium]